jgi:hypothetical protein
MSETKKREIEIGPDMIDAGIAELWNYDPQFSNERDVVAAIYKAMALLERRLSSRQRERGYPQSTA